MSPLILPPSQVKQFGMSFSLSMQQSNTSNYYPSTQKDTNINQMAISIAQYEQHTQLQSTISNLLSQQTKITTSLTELNSKTKVARSEMIKSLAISGGNAKNEQFIETVNTLEKLRNECSGLKCSLDEVGIELVEKRKMLDELCDEFPSLSNLSSTSQTDSEAAETSAAGSSTSAESTTLHISTKPTIEGNWFTLTKPTYLNCLGNNNHGNPMYTLGRMSFEMFRPSSLVVSIDAVWNVMEEVDLSSILNKGGKSDGDGVFTLPKTLIDEDLTGLRTYHIVTAFTIEPYSPSFGDTKDHPNSIVHSPIRGIMTTYGYALPDPEKVDRLSVWFSGGKMECGESKRSQEFNVWKQIFGNPSSSSPRKRRTFGQGVMVVAAKLLMGATGYNDDMDEESGAMGYSFTRPMGGHGKAYVDILHLDGQNRVMRGHAGTIYAFARM